MAKRKAYLRHSKRFSGNRSSSLYNSAVLDSNSSILDKEPTFWWNDLEENSSLRYSLIHNNGNETTQQLNQNSETELNQTTSHWWKYLSSDNEHNASSSKKDFDRVAVKTHYNIIASTSESENEVDVTKAKRINLRPAHRKAEENVFLDVLNNTDTDSVKVHHNVMVSITSESESEVDVTKAKRINLRPAHRKSEENVFLDVLNNTDTVAVKAHHNVVASSTSELENEVDVVKVKRINLRPARRKTEENVFLDVLNTDTGTDSGSSSLNNKNSQIKLHENIEDSPDLSLRLKPSIFKKKRGNKVEDRNIFQDALTEDSILNSSAKRKSSALEKEFLKNSIGQNIDINKDHINDQRKGSKKLSQTLSRDNEIDPSNVSTLKNQNATSENNIISDIEEVEHSNDESERLGRKRMKSYFLQRTRRSTGTNAFEIALADDKDVSALNASKKQLLNISNQMEKIEDNIEEDTSSSSLNNNETRNSVKFSKSKINYSRSHDMSLNENPQKESFEQNNTNKEFKNLKILIEQLSSLSPEKKTRLTRNSSRIRSETSTPTNKGARKVANDDNSEYSINEEQNPDTLVKQLPNSSLGKETRLTRNSSKMRSETPKSANKQAREITNDNLEHDMNKEQDLSTLDKELFKSKPGKKARLTRNSSRIRSKTSTSMNKGTRKVTDDDDSEYSINEEQNSDTLVKRLPNSSFGKETRLTRNSSKMRSETPKSANKQAREITNDNLEHDMNKEQDLSTLDKELSKSKPGKKARLTRNSSRIRSQTSTSMNKGTRKVTDDDDSEYSINEEQNSDTLVKRLPNSSFGKETRLTRNSSKMRSETPKSAHKRVREVMNDDNLEYNTNKKQDSNTLIKRLSESSAVKETRLTRNSSRIRSETPKAATKQAREVTNDNLEYDMNKEHDSSTLGKELSKSSSSKKARLTRNSSRNRYETPDFTSGATKLSTQFADENIEDVDNVSTSFEINVDDSLPITSSTRISSARTNDGVKAHENEEDVLATQMVQRKYPSPDNRTSNKTVNQQTLSTAANLNSIKENKETSHRQKSLNRSSQNYSTSIKALSKDISIRNKLNSPKKLRTIDDFFKVKQSSTTVAEPSTSNSKNLAPSQAFSEKMEKIKMELEKRNQNKSHEVAATDKKKYELKVRNTDPVIAVKQHAKNKVPAKPTKKVNKAFLVNGKVYKAPRLPRPKYWVTDHLYKFLWKRMEEKYKFATRIKSEKFVQELSKIVSFICNSKKYDSYKMELKALMKEMARLNIIKTRNDFYNFCWDFMPYEFRVKAVPILLPDNKRTIPYDPETLHTPLLNDNHYDE